MLCPKQNHNLWGGMHEMKIPFADPRVRATLKLKGVNIPCWPPLYFLQHEMANLPLSWTKQVHFRLFSGTELELSAHIAHPAVQLTPHHHVLLASCTLAHSHFDGGFGHADTAALLPAICDHDACQVLHWVDFITHYLIYPHVVGLLSISFMPRKFMPTCFSTEEIETIL